MDSNAFRFLILDANQRSALAVTRALGKHFPCSRVETAESRSDALAGASKYSKAQWTYPDTAVQPREFVNWLRKHCEGNRYDLILPMTEITCQLILLHNELAHLPVALAPIDTVMKIANKANLVKLAIKNDIPVPKSQYFENASQLQVDNLAFPCVLKPALSKIFTGSSWISTTVQIVKSLHHLEQILDQEAYLHEYPFMIQEYIPGHGAGLFCLYNQGEPVQFFAHQRLREKPPEGGVSVLSQSADVDETQKNIAVRLLNEAKWHGVAMVEFRVSSDGTPYLMEVNTRFWGSLQLAIDSDVNFPVQLVSIMLGIPFKTVESYRKQQQLRWLLGDLDSLYIYLKRKHSIRDKMHRAMSFLLPRFNRRKHEVNRTGDFRPFLRELKQYFSG
ncbi:ATP-grasp domain-containing protein [Reinekea sp. G2M2-21]|uniref:carboxylate--amine ligase n=1 Tax=Reinekea sp. G2M2-21 TaxID=2788942 RepID=UPI0018AA3452|nr:ATP-grasp domain-containing protein [Reinekea sp. G2M2-21]